MKPQTLCLCVLIVAFLLASQMPRVHGIGIVLTYQLLRLAAKELHHLMRGAGTGTNDIQLDHPPMQQAVIIILNNTKVIEEDGGESDKSQSLMNINISQKTDDIGEDKETASERLELIKKIRNWIRGFRGYSSPIPRI